MKYLVLALLAVCYAGHVTAMDAHQTPAEKIYKGTGSISGDITIPEPAELNKASVTGNANFSNTLVANDTHFLGSLTVSGATVLKDVTSTGNTTLGGDVHAKKTKFLSGLDIKGRSHLEKSEVKGNATFGDATVADHSTFSGTVHVSGDFVTQSSTFAKTVTVKASEVVLADSTVDNVILQFSGDAGEVPTIHLNNTKVNGTITFEGKEGKLVADKKSSFVEKNVSNARIERTA